MNKTEEQFDRLFKPLRVVTPQTSLLEETLAMLPVRDGVTIRGSARFLYLDVFRYTIMVGLVAVVLLLSPLMRGGDPFDELYALEIEAEEISQGIDDGEFSVVIDYVSDDMDLVGEDIIN